MINHHEKYAMKSSAHAAYRLHGEKQKISFYPSFYCSHSFGDSTVSKPYIAYAVTSDSDIHVLQVYTHCSVASISSLQK